MSTKYLTWVQFIGENGKITMMEEFEFESSEERDNKFKELKNKHYRGGETGKRVCCSDIPDQ